MIVDDNASEIQENGPGKQKNSLSSKTERYVTISIHPLHRANSESSCSKPVLKRAKPDEFAQIGGLKSNYSSYLSRRSAASSRTSIQSSEDGAFIAGELHEDESEETLRQARQRSQCQRSVFT